MSHIIPEFLYNPIYDEKHRFLAISTEPNSRDVTHQRGLQERLLCRECEEKLNVWEAYASRVIKGGLKLRSEPDDLGLTIHGVDYAKFKLFAMSLLWRAAVSSLREFEAVRLGRHEETLRRLLESENPGRSWKYGVAMVFPPDKHARELFGRAMIAPEMIRHNSHHLYRFGLGAVFWIFPVSSHMRELDRFLSLKEDGLLRLYDGGQPVMAFLRHIAKDFADKPGAGQAGLLRYET